MGYSWDNLISIVANLKYLGIDLEIHGVKRGQKIHSDWVPLRTYLVTECKQLINDQKYIQAVTDMKLNDALNSYWIMRGVKLGIFKDFASFCNCPKVKKILAVSLTKLDEQDIRAKNTLIGFANHYGDITKDKNNLESALNAAVNLFKNDLDQAIAIYPLLKGYDGYYSYPDTTMAKNLIEYVNAMYFVAHAG